jgi:hypothetical protein
LRRAGFVTCSERVVIVGVVSTDTRDLGLTLGKVTTSKVAQMKGTADGTYSISGWELGTVADNAVINATQSY